MKYIKSYENIEDSQYKIDDYVKVIKSGWTFFGKIYKVVPKEMYGVYYYYVNCIVKDELEGRLLSFSNIDRKLTSEEIEEYETKKNAIKFNL